MKRAYSLITIKSFDDDARTFEGLATTPKPDRMDDIVEPEGAEYSLPIPFLKGHNSSMPIGAITSVKVTAAGIYVKGHVEKAPDGPPTLKERLDVAWAEMKLGLIRGLSIGFNPLEWSDIKGSYGLRFTKWSWLELSAVVIPANADASILSVKSFDKQQSRAASGDTRSRVVRITPSSGASEPPKSTLKETDMTLKEQIAAFEAKRAAATAAMKTIMDKAAEEGATLTKEQAEEHDGHETDIDEIDAHLKRLKKHLTRMEKEVEDGDGDTTEIDTKANGGGEGGSTRVRHGDGRMKANANLPKGLAFTRLACALALSKGVTMQAYQMAQRWKNETPEVANFLDVACKMGGTTGWMQPDGPLVEVHKATVAAGNTTDTNWASPLVQYNNLASEFVALLRPRTIIGQLTGMRHVPFNIRFPSQSSGSTMNWVGQAAGKPVSKLQFATNTLGFAKAAGIVVITKELAMLSSPAAEALVQEDMLASMAQFLDQQFISPGVAAVANVSPASITNGLTPNQATGSTLTTFEADIATAMSVLVAGEIPFTSAVWITDPYTAMKIGMMRQSDGDLTFPNVSITGGVLYGIPLIVSNNVPHSVSAGSILVLMAQPEIFIADEGGVEIDSSGEASLQMDSAPTNADGTPTTLVSLWQTNMLGIRVERMINWQRRRTAAVTYIDNLHL